MSYPPGIVTRPVLAGDALAVTDGKPLIVKTVTVASRALIHVATGTRLEKVTNAEASPYKGEVLYWQTAVTDRDSEYLDADTRELIVLGPDEHTHTYTTTLTVWDEDEKVGEYVIGPYAVPTPEEPSQVMDLDTLQVVDITTGTAIPIPESWTQVVADAVAATGQLEPALGDIADLKTKTTTGYLAPAKVAPLVGGKLPDANVPDRLTETALSATIGQVGAVSFAALRPRVFDDTATLAAGDPTGFSDGGAVTRFGNSLITRHADGYYTHAPFGGANSAGYLRRYTGAVSEANGIRHIGADVSWPTTDVAAVALVLSDQAEWTDTPSAVRSVAKVHGVFYGNGIFHISTFNAPGETKYIDSEAAASAAAKVARFKDVRGSAAFRPLDIQFDPATGSITVVLPDGSSASKTVPALVGFQPNQAIWELYEPNGIGLGSSARFKNPRASVGPRPAASKELTRPEVGQMVNAAPLQTQLLRSRRSYRPATEETIALAITSAAEIVATGGAQVTRVSAIAPPSGKISVRIRAHITTATARAVFLQVWDTDTNAVVDSHRVIGTGEAAGSRWIDEDFDFSGIGAGVTKNYAIYSVISGPAASDAVINVGQIASPSTNPGRALLVEAFPVN